MKGKRGRPTPASVRQGQTVYVVYVDFARYRLVHSESIKIRTFFLHSQKVSLPPSGSIIERMPVSGMRQILSEQGNRDWFYSRRKALRHRETLRISSR